jgi:hypothetical protein
VDWYGLADWRNYNSCFSTSEEGSINVAWSSSDLVALAALRGSISRFKRVGPSPATAQMEPLIPRVDEQYTDYSSLLQQTSTLDFDDLIARCWKRAGSGMSCPCWQALVTNF